MPKITPYPTLTKQLTLKQKVGQLFMPAAFINDTEEEVQQLEKLIKEFHIGSICFFHSRASAATNFEGKKAIVHNEKSYDRLLQLIERYQKAAPLPLLIAIDAEWGLAMRIENTLQYPYAITLGAMHNQDNLVFQVGQGIARECKKAGIHWNLSPVVDINLNPENPVIGYRSFGDDKHTVTSYAKAYLQGMRAEGILNSVKHFPGHGDTATDSHLGLPIINKAKEMLLENEIHPFRELMDGDLDAVMVGHLAVPALSNGKKESASISKAIMTDFLREELGWEGVIISDALNMHAISKDFTQKGSLEQTAFEAGNDVLCFAEYVPQGIERIVKNSDPAQIEASFQRLWKLKERAYNTALKESEPLDLAYNSLMQELAQQSLTEMHGDSTLIQLFREQGFQTVQIGKQGGFFIETLASEASKTDNILLSIVPRQVKPNNHFNFSSEELESIISHLDQGNTIVYLFGNPFVLNLIPWQKARAVVVVYQDFEAFQKNAVAHFMGNSVAKGRLPVTLKHQNG